MSTFSDVAVPRRAYLWLARLLATISFLLLAWFAFSFTPDTFSLKESLQNIPTPSWVNTDFLSFDTKDYPEDGAPVDTQDATPDTVDESPQGGPDTDAPAPTTIWIVESMGAHDEVSAALAHAFGGLPNTALTMYLARTRYHMDEIVSNFSLAAPLLPTQPYSTFATAVRTLAPPDVLVSTTCELDLMAMPKTMRKLMAGGKTHLFCVVHHADRWVNGSHVKAAKEWVAKGKLDFVGLSAHTVQFLLERSITKWKGNVVVPARVFPPLFPVEVPPVEPSDDISLAIQGLFQSGRRNYNGIFRALDKVIKGSNITGTPSNITLHLIGAGTPPKVPAAVVPNVVFHQGLSYPEFYALLSSAFAMIPAFASDTYLDRKASSTVPAALIAGTPLVAGEALLGAYSYFPREAVWLAREDEAEMETVGRVLREGADVVAMRERLREARERILEENRQHVAEWVAEALGKMDGSA